MTDPTTPAARPLPADVAGRDAAAAAYDGVVDVILDEPCAFKRACFRAGWDAAIKAQAAQIAELKAERDALIATRDMMGNLWAMEKARVRTSPYARATLKGGDNG